MLYSFPSLVSYNLTDFYLILQAVVDFYRLTSGTLLLLLSFRLGCTNRETYRNEILALVKAGANSFRSVKLWPEPALLNGIANLKIYMILHITLPPSFAVETMLKQCVSGTSSCHPSLSLQVLAAAADRIPVLVFGNASLEP